MDDYDSGETTRKVLDSMKFAWTISEFDLYLDQRFGDSFESPTIKTNDCVWKIDAIVNSKAMGGTVKRFLGLRMSVDMMSVDEPSTENVRVIRSQYSISKNGTDYHTRKFLDPNPVAGYHALIDVDDLKAIDSIQSSQKLTIFCQGTALGDTIHVLDPIVEVPRCRHLDNLGDLLETGILSDVTIVASGQSIFAHKAVLAAQSTVFAAMFERDMKEKRENLVNITDVDADVVREMLRYIYVGRTKKLKELACELHAVADKYDLWELKVICEVEMGKAFSAKNAANILIAADLRGSVELKKKAMKYVVSHVAEVITTPGYEMIEQSYPHLITDLLTNGMAKNFKHQRYASFPYFEFRTTAICFFSLLFCVSSLYKAGIIIIEK